MSAKKEYHHDEELSRLTRRAHYLAEAELKNKHRQEYDRLVAKHREALGIPYTVPSRSVGGRKPKPRRWTIEDMHRRLKERSEE